MSLFEQYIEQVNELTGKLNKISRSFSYDEKLQWNRVERQILLNNETAMDLGASQTESLAFLMWTDSPEKIHNEQITIIGPELGEVKSELVPFGKIILVKVHGFNEDNAYNRFQEMDLIRFRLNLDGYMLRSIPQENKEWSRVGKKALQKGFSLRILGNEIIREYKKLDYVDDVEVIFITSSKEDVRKFVPIGEKVGKITQALCKMFDDLEMDCGHCDFNDVCNEIDGLKSMHQKATVA